MATLTTSEPTIYYPDSDGMPMADNTLQWEWMVRIKENLEDVYADDPQVFVAGDLLWYPVKGDNKTRVAPDAMVAFGRPKGRRGSYRQWEEDGVSPQVVFEVLSPGNRFGEMMDKFEFYRDHGVEEYYLFNPDNNALEGWTRQVGNLVKITAIDGWISPRLGIRFVLSEDGLEIFRPTGERFLTFNELSELRKLAVEQLAIEQQRTQEQIQRAEEERLARLQAQSRADAATQRADAATQRADAAMQRADVLAAKLRELGIDPGA